MKYKPYSFSKISTFSTCPRKFKYTYIDKFPQGDTDMTALFKGRAVHSILEHYPEKSDHKYAEKYQSIADKFINSKLGMKYLQSDSVREYKFSVNEQFYPIELKSKDTFFKGVIDYITKIDQEFNLCDWKTGKYTHVNNQNFSQLMFYSIYFFQKYQSLESIKLNYIYVEHDAENSLIVQRKYLDQYKEKLNTLISIIEDAQFFEKNKTKLCNYCSFKDYCDLDCT